MTVSKAQTELYWLAKFIVCKTYSLHALRVYLCSQSLQGHSLDFDNKESTCTCTLHRIP